MFGNVSNYVETEQVLEHNLTACSFTQIRGSLPFYWEQNGIQAKVEIHQSIDSNFKAFSLNLEAILKSHFRLKFINLLSDHKKQEKKLSHFQENLIQHLDDQKILQIEYQHIDFHSLVKETDFSKINPYVEKIVEKNDFSVFMHNFIDDNVEFVQKQNVLIRTNCLDCLDRTNAFQTKVSI